MGVLCFVKRAFSLAILASSVAIKAKAPESPIVIIVMERGSEDAYALCKLVAVNKKNYACLFFPVVCNCMHVLSVASSSAAFVCILEQSKVLTREVVSWW